MQIFSARRGQWRAATQSQEFFRTLQRYYSNAWMDAEKQDAINVYVLQSCLFSPTMSLGYIISSGWIYSMSVTFLLLMLCIAMLCRVFVSANTIFLFKKG